MTLDDCRGLLQHMEWADAIVWRAVPAAASSDPEIREKLHHLHQVQWVYLQMWRGEPMKPRNADTFATLDEIRVWARSYYAELPSHLDSVREETINRELKFPWAEQLVARYGAAYPASWGDTVLQVAMHSTYHRGQVSRRIRELGGAPPISDYIAWVWQNRPLPVWPA
jgi:uncharacterized damage-inducible protein DinB